MAKATTVDKKAWLRDIASPSNLWSAFQFGFPATAGTVNSAASWLLKLPPSVSVMIGLITAACLLVIISEIRKTSIYQKLSLERVNASGWSFDSSSMTGVLHLKADFISSHPDATIFYKVEVLSLVLEGLANRSQNYIGADVMQVSPNGRFGFLLGEIGPLKLGQIDGYLHFRVFYGKSENNLKHELEMRVKLSGVAFIDAQRGPLLAMKWMKEEMRTK